MVFVPQIIINIMAENPPHIKEWLQNKYFKDVWCSFSILPLNFEGLLVGSEKQVVLEAAEKKQLSRKKKVECLFLTVIC